MNILAIDQGTSGTKVLIISNGQVIARGASEIEVLHSFDGQVECDPNAIWDSIIVAAQLALRDGKVNGIKIDGVCLANQGESVLAWDKRTLEPKSKVIIWQDSRSHYLCNERAEFNEVIHKLSGLENDPYFVAPKMRWLKDRVKNNFMITTLDVWLIAKLTNNFVTDISTASRSMLLDLKTGTWNEELIKIWGLTDHELPTILNNDVIVGEIKALELPQLKGVLLAGIIVDQAAALLAEHCLNDGEAKCTYGTGAFLLSNIGDAYKISNNRLSTSFAWRIKDTTRYYADGQVFTATSAIDWLIKNSLLDSVHQIDSLPVDTNGVFALPGFAGFGAPRWNTNGRAKITGLTLGSSKGDIARAVINGIAAQVTELVGVIEKDGSIMKTMRVDGGLTQSKTLMQFQADLAQVEIEVFPHPDATAVGVGVLGRLALDKSLTLKSALPKIESSIKYSPKWSKDRALAYMSAWNKSIAGEI